MVSFLSGSMKHLSYLFSLLPFFLFCNEVFVQSLRKEQSVVCFFYLDGLYAFMSLVYLLCFRMFLLPCGILLEVSVQKQKLWLL